MSARASGVLLHPTSLPGEPGIGGLGPSAHEFVDALVAGGASVWQMLPVTAPGAFESPYDCRSAFAGNWLLISPLALVEEGLLAAATLERDESADPKVDFQKVRASRERLLRQAWEAWRSQASTRPVAALEEFRSAASRRGWLEDWALFAALDARLGEPWTAWPEPLRLRHRDALTSARHELSAEVEYQVFLQFLFQRQFDALRAHAERRGLRLCGDLPMYVSFHSADAWSHPELFDLDGDGRPRALAGVPPDAFSPAGQLWGAPVYRWAAHRASDWAWWISRVERQLELGDLLRLDHFRGFVAYWSVPRAATDASAGRWLRGPGEALFRAIETRLGSLPLIAEDLGRITPPVRRLRRRLGVPGMRVLQFAFDEADSDHLPERHGEDCVAYTGTHDNDTLTGWVESLEREPRERAAAYLDLPRTVGSAELVDGLRRAAFESRARLAIVPAQDLLGLGSEARMNLPGTVEGNWAWRMVEPLGDESIGMLSELSTTSGRCAGEGWP